MNARLPATRDRGVLLEPRVRGELVEQRDPRGATQKLNYSGYGDLAQVQEWDADQAFRLGYLANVIAYRCVQLRATTGSSVPIVAGRRLGDAKTINERAEISKLLGPPPGGPAPRLSASKLIRWTLAQEIVTGRRAWEIEADASGKPVAFWPLVSASLFATPSKGGNEWFSKFRYGNWSNPTWFGPEDVFYGWDPAGLDFRQAESGLQASRYDLSLVTMCDRYGISFLKNNAVPATIITTSPFPDEATKRAFQRQWNAEFGGVDNAGRFWHNEVEPGDDGNVAGSIDVKQLGLSAKDSRLVDQRKEAMQEIAISLGTPWSKLDASGRTFDNAEVEDRTYWEETILPDLTDLQDDINMQIAPRLGAEVCWFDLRGVRALQRKLIPVAQVPPLVDAAIITKNEGRAELGLEPVDGGDEFAEKQPVPAQLALPPSAPALPPAADDPTANTLADDGTARDAEPSETREVDPEAIEERRARVWRTSDAVVTGLEGRWERAWRKMFARQADVIASRLAGKRGRQATRAAEEQPVVQAVFDTSFWTAAATELAQSLYEDAATAGLTRVAMSFGLSFDVAAPHVQDFIEARANQLAGQVTQTTYEAVQTAMVEGVQAGESIDDIAARIRTVFTQAADNRAVTIARTEVISAYNGAASLGASTLPADVVAGQEWIATRDGRTREAHADADGQAVAIGSAFSVGGHDMAYPGDPAGGASNTVNCRCTVAFLTPGEFADVSTRAKRSIDHRTAKALLRALGHNDPHGDYLSFRLGAEEVAA